MGSQETPPGSKSLRPSLIQSPTQPSNQSTAPNQVLSSLASANSAEQVAAPSKLWKMLLTVSVVLALAVLVSVLVYLQINQDDNPPQVAFSKDVKRVPDAGALPLVHEKLVDRPVDTTAKIVDESPSLDNVAQPQVEQHKSQSESIRSVTHTDTKDLPHDPMPYSTKEALVEEPVSKQSLNTQELALPMLNANPSTTNNPTSTQTPTPTNTTSTIVAVVKPHIHKVEPVNSLVNARNVNPTNQTKAMSSNGATKLTAKPNTKSNTDRDVDLVSALVSNDIEPSDATDVKVVEKNGLKPKSQIAHHVANSAQDSVESKLALCKEKSFLERELCYVQMCTKLGGKHPVCLADQQPASIPGENK